MMKGERDEPPSDRSEVQRCVPQTNDNQGTCATKDYLSQLPEDVLLSVLTYLQLRDIVQTSSTSQYLKNAASSISRLNFDLWNLFMVKHNFDPVQWAEVPEVCCREYKCRFVDGVNQFLSFHQGKNLLVVKLSFCLGVDDREDIDRWIRFAVKKDVVTLRLAFYCDKRRGAAMALFTLDWRIKNRYVVNDKLFEGLNTKLKKLELVCCELCPEFSVDFHGLTWLLLEDMPLHKHDLESIFLCLPNLETLQLARCCLPEKLSFGSLTLLRQLEIRRCLGVFDIDLCNSALYNFQIRVCQSNRCNLNGAPNLTMIGLSSDEDGLQYVFTSLAKDFPSLDCLFVHSGANWGKWIPEGIHTFNQLKYMRLLFSNDTRFDILKLISLLQALPVLCRFFLHTNCREDAERGRPDLGEHVHPYLTEAAIEGPLCTPSQLEMITYFLKHAPALKSLFIRKCLLNKYYCNMHQSWDEGEREYICKILEESRAYRGSTKIRLLPE